MSVKMESPRTIRRGPSFRIGTEALVMPTPGDMVLIPKGSVFYSDPTQRPGLVRDDYYIDVFPVTNEHYHSFLVDHPETVEVPNLEYVSGGADRWDKRTRTFPAGKGDHPVVILGSNCRVFCAWLAAG